jgi:hypothetical protein
VQNMAQQYRDSVLQVQKDPAREAEASHVGTVFTVLVLRKFSIKKKLRSRKFGAATKITWSDYKERTWRIRFDTATLQGLFLIFLIFDHVSIRSQSPFDELTTDSCETDGWIAVHPKKLGFGRMLKTWLKEVVPTLEHLRWGCHTWLGKWNMWRPGATPSSTFFFSHTVREWHGIATNI